MKRNACFTLLTGIFLLFFCGCSQQTNNSKNFDSNNEITSSFETTLHKSENSLQTTILESIENDNNDLGSTSETNTFIEQNIPAKSDILTDLPTQTETNQTNIVSKYSNDSVLDLYKSVLKNNSGFFDIDTEENFKISQYLDSLSQASGSSVEITTFAIVDLDNNDIPEIILWEIINDHVNYGFKILRHQNGEISGFYLGYRSFSNLKVDGTFHFSGGAFDNGFGTINFDINSEHKEMADWINKKTYCQSNGSDITYFVDNKISNSDEFEIAMEQQGNKTEVTWYDFTEENIETLFSTP